MQQYWSVQAGVDSVWHTISTDTLYALMCITLWTTGTIVLTSKVVCGHSRYNHATSPVASTDTSMLAISYHVALSMHILHGICTFLIDT